MLLTKQQNPILTTSRRYILWKLQQLGSDVIQKTIDPVLSFTKVDGRTKFGGIQDRTVYYVKSFSSIHGWCEQTTVVKGMLKSGLLQPVAKYSSNLILTDLAIRLLAKRYEKSEPEFSFDIELPSDYVEKFKASDRHRQDDIHRQLLNRNRKSKNG